MTDTTSIVAVYGNTFPVKDDLKKLGFRFRRTGGSHDYADKHLDRGFNMDVPIWFMQTDDLDATFGQIADFDGIKVKVGGKSVDIGSVSVDTGFDGDHASFASFASDTDDDLFDSAFTPRFA